MKLVSGPLSLFAKKVEIALDEKAIAHERVLAAFSQTQGYAPRHPDVLAHNPKGQVPVLIDGDLALYDSTVIIEYLEDISPSPPLFPKEPRERARCRLLELYADEIILASLRQLMHRNEPGASLRPDWTARETAAAAAETALDAHYAKFEGELAPGNFLCGEFSAADIAVFLQFFYAQRLGGPSMKKYPRLWDWYRRVKARPAVARMIHETLRADAELSAPVVGAFKDSP
ncbi:MAG: glutathione S-transferase [Alphaproteobacteria bacterium RIFCSPHIGHO2_12_FULL_63_12]|nr:MAG: glutathione S-transferase [Alphaproteobacteria bacterium RIFCSPHIGHO2_12_FULL_63_12]